MMIWIVALAVVGYILYRYASELQKDNVDLTSIPVHERFSLIVDELNSAVFSGKAIITTHDKRTFSLYQSGNDEIIYFHYRRGHLTITWKLMYCEKEVVHERQFSSVRNLSAAEQQDIAEQMVIEIYTISEHQQNSIDESIRANFSIANGAHKSLQPSDTALERQPVLEV